MVAMPLNFPVPTASQLQTVVDNKVTSSAQSVAAFRACHQRFEDCLEFADAHSASPVLETASNFVLDFDIIAKRTMGTETTRYRLFQMHFLKSMDRKTCCAKLHLSHWAFASEVLAIEQLLGRAFTNAGLFPVAPYFNESCARLEKIAA